MRLARIGIVGDVMLTERLRLFENSGGNTWLQSWTRDVDVAIANLEMALPKKERAADKLSVIHGNPYSIHDIAGCGFSILTMSNNHMMDHGADGLLDTLEAVDEAGLTSVGAGRDIEEASQILFVEMPDGGQLAIVNFSCTLPPGAAAGPSRPGIAPVRVTQQHEVDPIFIQEQPGTSPWVNTYVRPQDSRLICERIAEARNRADLVLVIIHWGVPPHWHAPFQGSLATYQRDLAKTLVEAGAHAIVGHHPHVLHGVEVIDNSPVFYSLGNFIWHHRLKRKPGKDIPMYEPGYRVHWQAALATSGADLLKRESIFLQLTWHGSSWQAELRPLWLDEFGEPTLPDAEMREQILDRLKVMSRQLGCSLSQNEDAAFISGYYS